MYGVKTSINGIEKIYWLHESEYITRLLVSITIHITMEKLKELENWEVLEDSNTKYSVRGKLTGTIFSTEIIGV